MDLTRAAWRRRSGMVTTLGCALAFACVPSSALAATITVTTNADTVAADGQCSLREAVTAANLDAAGNGCPAGLGGDTISLGTATYDLQGSELLIMNDVAITGAGAAATTINQAVGPARVLHIIPGGAALTLTVLT